MHGSSPRTIGGSSPDFYHGSIHSGRSLFRGAVENRGVAANQWCTPRKVKSREIHLPQRENALNIYVRVRPLKETETTSGIDVDENSVILRPPAKQLQGRGQTKVFPFKKVFGPFIDQETVFQQSISELLPALAQGRDLLFFAYGVTGAGKTYTIEGTRETPGILHQTLSAILSSMNSGSPVRLSDYDELSVSCFEIFNEKIYDLLTPRGHTKKSPKVAPAKPSLQLTRDSDGRTLVEGACEYSISDQAQIDALVQTANAERHKAETTYNHNSSRSHVIFRMTLKGKRKAPVCISVVDLAGCERTKTLEDSRLRESCNINKSMMVLGRCIRSLANHQQAVPYRESLITRLFKDFFESPGKCAVAAVMVNITPSVDQFEDTSFSLSFAVDASKCYTTGSMIQTDDVDSQASRDVIDPNFQQDLVAQTQKYLDNIEKTYRTQVEGIMERTRCANVLHSEISQYVMRADYEKLQQENRELRERLNAALEKISELTES